MKTAEMTKYIQDMELLIEMQEQEIGLLRNLLGRATYNKDLVLEKDEFYIHDFTDFKIDTTGDNLIVKSHTIPSGTKPNFQRILELKEKLK